MISRTTILFLLLTYSALGQNVGINNPTPVEKLDIIGNLKITGLVKPNGTTGSIGQVLSNNGDGTMSWVNPSSAWSYVDQSIRNNNLGNVGIGGAPSGSALLDVFGNGIYTRNDGNTNSLFVNNSTLALQRTYPFPGQKEVYLKFDEESIQSAINFPVIGPSAKSLHINPYGGQVTIGSGKNLINGGYKLAVNGSVKCREVVVENLDWPDYVFEKTYPLASIEEVEKFIQKNGHLPKIPSAETVKQNGQHLGETQKLMMEKIEELTLYIIQLKKEIDILKSKNK